MQILLTSEEFRSLSPSAQAEVLAIITGSLRGAERRLPAEVPEVDTRPLADFEWDYVAELTYRQVRDWMKNASDKTKAGLRVIAECGPIIDTKLLTEEAGIDNLSQFQSRTTIRTRTVTGDKEAFLLTWDEWEYEEDGQLKSGRYAVTPITHQSLRRYFGLDA